MVKIRLARHGSKKRPFYQIVVADSRFPRDGRFLEKIGYFSPIASEKSNSFKINVDRMQHWIKNGAIVSHRISSLIKKQKIVNN